MDKYLDHANSAALDTALRFGPKVLVALLIMVAGAIAGRWLGRATEQGLTKLELEPPVWLLLVRVDVFGLFAIIALQNLGVELLPLIAGHSVAGAGLTLAT
jgi:small conductance mechanosensitive channel